MLHSKKVLCVLLTAIALPAFLAVAADEASELTCKCPVAGKKLTVSNASASADYKDATVYFCCGGCKAKFESDTKKFATKANKQLVATKQAKQVKCPIAGRPVNKDKVVTIDDVKVNVCCGGCKGKVDRADESDKLAMVFGEKAFKKAFEVVEK